MHVHHSHVHGESLTTEVIECEWCGEEFEDLETCERVYCSNDCRGKGEAMVGEDNPFYGKNHTEETKQILSEKQSGENHPFYGKERPEVGKKVSESKKGHKPTYPKARYVDDLGHHVRSKWEEEVGRVLIEAGIGYEYESVEYEYGEGNIYYPDFSIGNVIIEVKGPVFEESIEKANVMKENKEVTYIVVGSQMPCDVYLPMEEVEALPEVLEGL